MTSDLNELVVPELSRRWNDRHSIELHDLYDEWREAPRKQNTRRMMWVAAIIYILFAGLDFCLIPDVFVWTAGVRLLCSIVAILAVEMLIHRNVSAENFDAVSGAVIFFCYLGWIIPASLSSNADALSYYLIFGVVFMMISNLFFDFSFRVAAIWSFSILTVCILSIYIPDQTPSSYRITFSAFYTSCLAITLYVNWKLNVEHYNVFLNALQADIRQKVVTERGEALLQLSNTDALTGLKNRRAIDEKLKAYWAEWQAEERSFTALLIDIDFFKNFNDHYGHQEGDRCLILVAKALSDLVERHGGSVGRFGGEEFIVLARLPDSEAVAPLAESIRRAVEDLHLEHEQRPDGERIVTVSIGAAVSGRQQDGKLERLITEADRALYRAKAGGRNCVWVFDPNEPQEQDDSGNIAEALRVAVAEGLVSLVYQPIRDLSSNRTAAAESLMRLKMPDGRMISPLIFIPVAERSGDIIELGRWAIRTACQVLIAEAWLPVLSVNVSALQLKAPGFSISVAAILGETGVSPERLAFEITEGREIESHPDVLRSIAELKQLGVKLWLDDFGTGFAGLSSLRAIEFDTVKIDRSFLHDTATAKGKRLFQDMVSLIGNRDLGIIVEGVETERQLGLMHTLGVQCVQGFHVGRPMPAESLRKYHIHEAAAAKGLVLVSG